MGVIALSRIQESISILSGKEPTVNRLSFQHRPEVLQEGTKGRLNAGKILETAIELSVWTKLYEQQPIRRKETTTNGTKDKQRYGTINTDARKSERENLE